jgi:hypothetical protein
LIKQCYLQILIYITYLAELLPFILALFFFKKIKTTELRVFLLYTSVFALFLLLTLFFKFYLKNPVLQLLSNRIFLVSEFIFLSLFYYHILIGKLKRVVIPVAVLSFVTHSVYDYYTSKSGEFTFMPLVAECFFFILVIVYFMYEKIQYSVSSPIYYLPSFWISVAFLIYFSGNFFLFLFSKSMFNNPDFREQYTLIYSTVTIMKNIFLCTALITNSNLVEHEKNTGRRIDVELGAFNQFANPLTHNHK